MKRIAFFTLLLFTGIILSCKDEETTPETIQLENTDINKFAHSVYQNMDSTVGFAKIQLNQIMSDGQLNGDAIATSGHPLAPMIKMYYDAIFAAIKIDSPIFIIAKDFDFQKKQITEGIAVIEIADQEGFQTVIKDFAEIKKVGNLNHASLNNAHLVWQENIALIGFSNTSDGKELVVSAFQNGAKLDASDLLSKKELKNDDIYILIEAKKIIAKGIQELKTPKQEMLRKVMEQLAVDADDSHIETSINFNKGQVDIHTKTYASEKLLPLIDILKSSNTNDLANSINSPSSIGNLLINVDVNKFASNYGAYIIDNELSDATTSQQLNGLVLYINGNVALNLENFDNKKAKMALAYGKKENSIYDFLLMQAVKDNIVIENKKNTIYFDKDKTLKTAPVSGNEHLLNHGITGKFDITKLNKTELNGIQTAISNEIITIEASGDLKEMNVTIKGKNEQQNILHAILNALKTNINPNEIPM